MLLARRSVLLLACFATLVHGCIPTKTPQPGIPAMPPAEPPACKKCTRDMITTEKTEPGASPTFTADMVDTSGACAKIDFVCAGPGPAPIPEIKLNGVRVYDADDGAADKVAHATVTCNADGTAWTYKDGSTITLATCFPGTGGG